MPVLSELVNRKMPRFPIEVGVVTDFDSEKNLFIVFLPKRKKTLKLAPPVYMLEKIRIPANTFTITIPSQTVTDSGGDTVTIPSQTITFPENDIFLERFKLENFIGSFVLVVNPVTAPRLVGFISEVRKWT